MHLEKLNTFKNDIIVIDGLWGTGKSVLSPILSGMGGVEKIKADSIYEYMSLLYSLGKIQKDAAIWMMRTYADSSQYHNRIGREINLRWSDDTGLKYVRNKLSYICRLFGHEGDRKVAEINEKNLAFSVMSHMLMLTPDLLLTAFGNRVKVIEMVRHPLYMFEHFSSYLDRYESPREFTVSFYYNGVKIPWFIKGHEKTFINANRVEKAVLSILLLYPRLFKKIKEAQEDGLQLLTLSFEDAVLKTDKTLENLQHFTGRPHSKNIGAILRQQKLPRKIISNGRGHANYGWVKSDNSERSEYLSKLKTISQSCSKQLYSSMLLLIDSYNDLFPNELAKFSSRY
jgi:hypothetical protein